MIRTVKTRFPFNGMPKGLKFTYDTETDLHIPRLLAAGVLEDVTSAPTTIVFEMPSIESAEEVGDIGGEGEDQPSTGGGDDPEADDAPGSQDVLGDEGHGPEVAKGRKRRVDVSKNG